MFLKQVYRHSKLMCGGILFFVACQLFVLVKRGMVFSPWFNYGMYSEPVHVQPLYQVQKVSGVGGREWSPQKWDAIHYTFSQYLSLPRNDSFYKSQVARIFPRLFFFQPAARNFIPDIDSNDFSGWYREHLQTVLHSPFTWYHAENAEYSWNGEQLIPK